MKRDIGALTGECFDLLVVGGGVHGAFATWDAALRGLRVALIERGDFGCATSSNSLKIAHGGFRHLRNGDLRALCASLDEQIALQRIAPHLVRPLPCVMQSGHRLTRSSSLMRAASGFYRGVARQRANHGGTARPPAMDAGGIVKGAELARLLAPLEPGWQSGAMWMDAIIESPERLLIGVLRSAVDAGAVAASYVEARSICPRDGGVTVRAMADGEGPFTIRTRLVLDARGPWTNRALVRGEDDASSASAVHMESDSKARPRGGDGRISPRSPLARACNIVVRAPVPRAAVALPHPSESRMLFAVPWRGRLMLGTSYEPARLSRNPREGVDVDALIRLFDAALPGVSLDRHSLEYVHCGLLPATEADDHTVEPRDRPTIVDFRERYDIDGIVSMVGVKWTTARAVAERAVGLCQMKLGGSVGRGGTDRRPIVGAEGADPPAHPSAARRPHGCTEAEQGAPRFDRGLYGTLAAEVDELACRDRMLATPLAAGSRVIGAQIAHAIRHEMALHLDDIVLRRSELGTAGMPSEAELSAAAAIAAAELGWSSTQAADELARVRAAYWWRCT